MPVFILLALMSVPLAWIASRTFLKAKALEADRHNELHLRLLESEMTEVKRRLEVLETIATETSEERVTVEPLPELERLRAQSETLQPRA